MMTLINMLVMLLEIYIWVIILRAVMSWVAPVPSHPLAQILVNVTEPVLKPLRRLVPPSALRESMSPPSSPSWPSSSSATV